jgi:sugar diacid utilization regulator
LCACTNRFEASTRRTTAQSSTRRCSATSGSSWPNRVSPSFAAESATGEPFPELQPGFVVGTARGRPAENAAESWRQAQAARRFCGLLGLGSVVDYDELGSLATLAELPQDAIVSNPDVRAIAELMSTGRGPAVVETLQQRFASGSIRETAAALYLHHSSVRYRLQPAENSLGLDLDDPRSRLRAELALILWRMSSS